VKILLIKPNWRLVNQVITPPMGIISLAAYLRDRMDEPPEIVVYDQAVEQGSMADVKRILNEEKPDIVGISALTYEAICIKAISKISKEVLPDAVVIVGGPHATVFYDDILEKTSADITVLGEGEQTFLELVERIRDKTDWVDVDGIAFRGENGEVVKSPEREPIIDMDSLPFPAWELIDIPKYCHFKNMNDFLKKAPYMFIFTSRACPFGCLYCHRIFGKKFRARSVDNVIEEIRILIRDHGIKEIHIIDDIFNWDLDRAKNICRRIIAEGIKVNIAFPNGLRADRMDDELIELLGKAGCYSMSFAVETATPRLQKMLRKFADLDKLSWAINRADREGIIPKGFFMLGFPTETREELEATVNFACKSKLLVASFFAVSPFPRTGLFDLFKETYPEMFKEDAYYLEAMDYFTSESYYQKATGIDLATLIQNAYKRFYLKPSRILKIFTRFPRNMDFLRGLYRGFSAMLNIGNRIEMLIIKIKRRRIGAVNATEL